MGEAGNDSHTTQTVSKRCVGNKTHKEGRVRNRLPCVRRLGAMGNGCRDMRPSVEMRGVGWREKGTWPEAAPNKTHMPRFLKQARECSNVSRPTPSNTQCTPAPPDVTGMKRGGSRGGSAQVNRNSVVVVGHTTGTCDLLDRQGKVSVRYGVVRACSGHKRLLLGGRRCRDN